jgi:RNA recognition motif-containing protein
MQVSKLYVGNLSYSVTSEQLKELFSNHGQVNDVRIIDGKGFGFVEMSSIDEAENAKNALDGSEYEGRTMKVDEARPKRENNNRRNNYRY